MEAAGTEVALDVWAEIDRLLPFVRARQWEALETAARAVCMVHSGPGFAERIAAVDTSAYEQALRQTAVDLAPLCPSTARSVCFEFDPDADWEGTFFLCTDARCVDLQEDDEWACDWVGHLDGPDFAEFGRLYEEGGGFRRTALSAAAAALFLFVRTLTAFARAMDGLDFGDRALCLAVHDQADVLRVREIG